MAGTVTWSCRTRVTGSWAAAPATASATPTTTDAPAPPTSATPPVTPPPTSPTGNNLGAEYCAKNQDPGCPAGSFVGPDAIPNPNGDGTTDVLLQNGGTVVDWLMKNGQYQSGNVITTGATGFSGVGAGDSRGHGGFWHDNVRLRLWLREVWADKERAEALVALGGREALGEARAKYLNTAQTEIFHKGELLYNHHRASRPARERREVLLAEALYRAWTVMVNHPYHRE